MDVSKLLVVGKQLRRIASATGTRRAAFADNTAGGQAGDCRLHSSVHDFGQDAAHVIRIQGPPDTLAGQPRGKAVVAMLGERGTLLLVGWLESRKAHACMYVWI